VLRQVADAALFSGFQDEIRFGVISLDGSGALNYGRCFLVLRDDMIAHRATVFESNAVLWMKHYAMRLDSLVDLPPGYRATWEQRSEIAVAKLAAQVRADLDHSAIAALLLRNGSGTADDDFIEVHIYGPMTIRTCASVVVTNGHDAADEVISKAVIEQLRSMNVEYEERQ
jgi:hypothetical protein